MLNINSLLRENIKKLKPYSSARNEFDGEKAIFLDANENPNCLDELPEKINRYPDPLQKNLKEKLSKLKGVNTENIFVGNGSDEAIDLLIRCFCNPSIDSILIFPPTYGMYKVCANINNVIVEEQPLDVNFCIDFEQISSNSKIAFICNPNNPTGNVQDKDKLLDFIAQFNGIIVIDEAYIDFCPEESLVDKLSEYPNLVILQTLSKAWALAGARVGIALASKEIIDVLSKVKYPYNINNLSLTVAEMALNSQTQAKNYIDEIVSERERLMKVLPSLPSVIKVYQSKANFILVKTQDANTLYKYFIQNGIVVRYRNLEIGCKGCLRITVGTNDENERLINTWEKFNLSVSL